MAELIAYYNQEPVIQELPSTIMRRDMANAMAEHLDALQELKADIASCVDGVCSLGSFKPRR